MLKRPFVFFPVLFLLLATLACNIPDTWVDAVYHLPTLTPTATSVPSRILFVAKTGDDGNDCVALARPCLTIMAAVNKAPNGALINIGPGTYEEIGEYGNEGVIIRDKNLSMRGSGAPGALTTIISGANRRDAFIVTGTAHAVIEDVVISGGGSAGGGVGFGLYVTGTANATLRDSAVRGNELAGIRSMGNVTVILENVAVSANNAGGISNQLGNVTIRGSRIVNNLGQPAVYTVGNMTISDSTISGNQSSLAGTGIFNAESGVLRLERSTISGNRLAGVSQDYAIYNYPGAHMSMVNTTVSGNSGTGIASFGDLSMAYSTVAANAGAGLFANTLFHGAVVQLQIENSILENNGGQDCIYQGGAEIRFDLRGHNLSDGSCAITRGVVFTRPAGSTDTLLGPLASNGGPTQTHALLTGSAAIDGATGGCYSTDQRGVGRPVGGGCDIGAFEYTFALLAATPELTATSTATSVVTSTATPIPLITDTATPFLTLTPTAATKPTLTFSQNTNCRKGPGTVYESVDAFLAGQTVQVDGRSEMAPWWWWVLRPNSKQHCWVSSASGQPSGDPSQLSAVEAPPTPTVTSRPNSPLDFDHDGYPANKDCDDKNAKIHPGAPESPNDNIDSNCNGDPNK